MALVPPVTIILAVAALISVICHIAKPSGVPVWLPVLLMSIAMCLAVLPK